MISYRNIIITLLQGVNMLLWKWSICAIITADAAAAVIALIFCSANPGEKC